MGRLLIVAACLAMMSTAANAKTWAAVCTDGQNVEFDQQENNLGKITFKTTDGKPIVIAATRITTSPTGDVLCGFAASKYEVGQHQLCINAKEGTIFFRAPPPSRDDLGTFCKAKVIIK